MLLVWVGSSFEHWRRGVPILALAGAMAPWLSHPSVFVLAAVGTVTLATAIHRGAWSDVALRCSAIAAWLGSFGLAHAVALRSLLDNDRLHAFWRAGFPPEPATASAVASWLVESALGLSYLSFFEAGLVGPLAPPAWWEPGNALALAATVVGLACAFLVATRFALTFALATGATLAASVLGLYPFRGRLLLFLVPLVYLAASSTVEWIATRRARWRGWLAGVALIVLIAPMAWRALHLVVEPTVHNEIVSALAHVRAHHARGDVVLLDNYSGPVFDFYAERFGLDGTTALVLPRAAPDVIIGELCRSGPRGRSWIVIDNWFDEHAALLAVLRSKLAPLDSFEEHDVSAYLFDFASSDLCGDERSAGS
jgi:hypothetical protein